MLVRIRSGLENAWTARRVEIVAQESTTLVDLLAILASIRGPGCDARGDCRLPDVVLRPYLRL